MGAPSAEQLALAKVRVLDELDPFDPAADWLFGDQVAFNAQVRDTIARLFAHQPDLAQALDHALLGWGPLQSVWEDPRVEELNVNGADEIFCVVDGRRERVDVRLEPGQLMLLVQSHLGRVGRQISHHQPLVGATLADGSRIEAQASAVATSSEGAFTLRRQRRIERTLGALAQTGLMDPAGLGLLTAAVVAQKNILVAGSPGAGKTTLLSALVAAAPAHRRIVTLEDAAEVDVPGGRNHIGLLSRPAGSQGAGAVDHAQLMVASKRMGPDLVVLGEVRDGEAAELVRAMRAGDGGAMGTIHARSCKDALSELCNLARKGGSDPLRVQEIVAEAVDLVVYVSRDRSDAGGHRRIMAIATPELVAGELEASPVLVFDPPSQGWQVHAIGVFHDLGVGLGRRGPHA